MKKRFVGKGDGKFDASDRGWSFSMDNIFKKIAIVRTVFVYRSGGSISHVDSTTSVTEHNFLLCFAVSHFLSHGLFILSSTLPQRSPVLHVLIHPDAYH